MNAWLASRHALRVVSSLSLTLTFSHSLPPSLSFSAACVQLVILTLSSRALSSSWPCEGLQKRHHCCLCQPSFLSPHLLFILSPLSPQPVNPFDSSSLSPTRSLSLSGMVWFIREAMLLISPLKMDGKQRAGVRDLIWSSVRWCVCVCMCPYMCWKDGKDECLAGSVSLCQCVSVCVCVRFDANLFWLLNQQFKFSFCGLFRSIEQNDLIVSTLYFSHLQC